MDLIPKIRELRLSRGYTRNRLAAMLDIPYSTLTNYENGTRTPPLSTLVAVADLFGVSVDSLLGIETCLKPMSRGDCYRNMPDDKLAVALMRLIDQGDAPFCQCKSECKMHIDDITTEMCVSCMVDYLKQPAEEAVYG